MIGTYVKRLIRRAVSAAGVTAMSTQNLPFGVDWMLDVKRLETSTQPRKRTIFDVGANDGTITMRLKEQFSDATIHAFEPHPDAYSALTAKKFINPSQCHKIALSNSVGSAILYAPRYDKMSSLLPNAPAFRGAKVDLKEIMVDTTTIDQFCEINHINIVDILKIDVEGEDLTALQGAVNMLNYGNICFVYVEFNQYLSKPSVAGDLDLICEFLWPFGMRAVATYTEQVHRAEPFSLVSNVLFFNPKSI